MPRQTPHRLVIEAALGGVENAEKTYEEWSGGEWLAYSAEHMICEFVARSLMRLPGSKSLTIEQSCRDTIEAACGKRRGRLAQASRPNGRIDLLLWWATDSPRTVIEVKNNVYNYVGQCKGDIDRIAHLLLMRDTTLQSGLFVFYSSADDGKIKDAREKLTGRFGGILSRAKSEWGEVLRVTGRVKVHRYGIGAWAAACIILQPR